MPPEILAGSGTGLPADSAGLWPIGLDTYGFPLEQYQRRYQDQSQVPLRSSDIDFTTQERISVWEQDDYTGGGYQDRYDDPEMVYRVWGAAPSQRKKTLRPVTAMLRRGNLGFGASENPTRIVTQGDTAILLSPYTAAKPSSQLAYYREDSLGTVTTGIITPGSGAVSMTIDRAASQVLVGCQDGKLRRYSVSNLTAGTVTNPTDSKGNAISGSLGLVEFFGESLFGCFGKVLYRLNDAGKWERVGTSKNPSRGALPAPPIDACAYNGQLYILCGVNGLEGFVCTTTGSDVQTVVDIPFAVIPQKLQTYAGRLYVACTGYDLDAVDRYGELYELTGNTLRLVRTFSPDYAGVNAKYGAVGFDTYVNFPRQMASLCVQEGLLWFPSKRPDGLVLGIYDRSTDGFFSSGPFVKSYTTSPVAFTLQNSGAITAVAALRDRVLAWVSSADSTARGLYLTMDAYQLGLLNGSLNGPVRGYVETSWYAPKPDRVKRWLRVAVKHAGHQDAIRGVHYSIDGSTWSFLSVSQYRAAGDIWVSYWTVPAAAASRAIKLRIYYDPTDCELYGHSLNFHWGRDPDSPRLWWQVQVPCVDGVEGFDGAPGPATGMQIRNALWALCDSGASFAFRDIDGSTKRVVAVTPYETRPWVNDSGESRFTLSLVEVGV